MKRVSCPKCTFVGSSHGSMVVHFGNNHPRDLRRCPSEENWAEPSSIALLKQWCAQERQRSQDGHPGMDGVMEHVKATEDLISQLTNKNKLRDLESLITGHMEAMRPLLEEWDTLRKKKLL